DECSRDLDAPGVAVEGVRDNEHDDEHRAVDEREPVGIEAVEAEHHERGEEHHRRFETEGDREEGLGETALAPHAAGSSGVGHGFHPSAAASVDRKSTRLNSSHVKISYAV